jgi:large subunit ribosomal protein L17
MNNKTGFNRLSRKPSHRRALVRNLVKALFQYEQIETTRAKAKEASRKAEKIITRAKVDTVHNRRMVARDIAEKELVKKIFSDIAPRSASRNGGYTRIVKLGFRQGDAAQMVVLELVDRAGKTETDATEKPAKKRPAAKKSPAKKSETAGASAPKAKKSSEEKEQEGSEEKAKKSSPAKKTAAQTDDDVKNQDNA